MRNLANMVSNPKLDNMDEQIAGRLPGDELDSQAIREKRVARLRLLWSQRRLLFRVTVIGFVLALIVAFLIPTRYQSDTQLMPPDSGSSTGLALMAAFSNQSGELGAMASDLLGAKTTGSLFIGVLRSRTVEDRIVDRFNLEKVYGERLSYEARQTLEERTGIAEDRKSGIITVSVTDHDPKRAAGIASAYVDELNVLMAQLNTSSAHRERVFLEDRLHAVNQDLESAEKDFAQFSSKNGTVDISAQGRAAVEGVASIEGQLIAAQSELQGLKQIYTDDNVRVRSTQARINELRAQLDKLGGTAAESSSQNANGSDGDVYPTLRQLPLLGVPYADKYRQFRVEEVVYETLTKQYELAKVEEAKETPSVKVLDAPEVPEHKSFPPRFLIIFMGTACALLIGGAYALGSAQWRETDPQDPRRLLAQEIVGTLKTRASWFSQNGNNQGTKALEDLHQDSVRARPPKSRAEE